VMSTFAGPSTPGTPLMLLHRPLSLASHQATPGYDPRVQPLRGSTGLPKGGMGAIPAAMAKSLQSRGVDIRCGCGVDSILVGSRGVEGVRLESGEVVRSPIVVSNLNPKTTLLRLVEEGGIDRQTRSRLEALMMKGNAFKIGLGLDDLPRFAVARNEDETLAFAACQFRIAPSMDYLDRAYDDAKYGIPSQGPVCWGLTPSVTNPSLAPPGKHLMSVNIYHAPYQLRGASWATERERYGHHCIDVLSEYIPNLKKIINQARFWSPLDFEDEYGLLEANITHGDMLPGRMFSLRPYAGSAGYRTPLSGLYLCGVGTWPGGFVSGIPGHNAAHQILRDMGRGALVEPESEPSCSDA
jgi:phytoene dehydrogenase-like protein